VEKQEIRKLNYVSILSAIYTIAKENYKDIALEAYEKIPNNDRKLFDLKLKNLSYPLLGSNYILDIGIQRPEVDNETHDDFYYSSRIIDQGDLSTYYGYETLDAEGYTVTQAKIYPETLSSLKGLKTIDPMTVLKKGYGYVRIKDIPLEEVSVPMPIHIISETYEQPELRLEVGINPTFFLEKDGVLRYAVINGFLIDLSTEKGNFGNAMIYR